MRTVLMIVLLVLWHSGCRRTGPDACSNAACTSTRTGTGSNPFGAEYVRSAARRVCGV